MAGEYALISIIPVPSDVIQGDPTTITVNLAGAPDQNQSVIVNTSNPLLFTDMPSCVVVVVLVVTLHRCKQKFGRLFVEK